VAHPCVLRWAIEVLYITVERGDQRSADAHFGRGVRLVVGGVGCVWRRENGVAIGMAWWLCRDLGLSRWILGCEM
jgi:hypothetical protein